MANGHLYRMTFESMTDATIVGFVAKKKIAVPLKEVSDIRYQQVSFWKSAGVTAITLTVAFVVYIGVVLANISD